MYYRPRCPKSHKTLQLLKEKGYELKIIEHLRTLPPRDKLAEILRFLNMKPRDMMRTKEKMCMEHGLSDPGLSQAELIDAMAQYRVLFERHIVLANEQAAMGCHPEQIFTIF